MLLQAIFCRSHLHWRCAYSRCFRTTKLLVWIRWRIIWLRFRNHKFRLVCGKLLLYSFIYDPLIIRPFRAWHPGWISGSRARGAFLQCKINSYERKQQHNYDEDWSVEIQWFTILLLSLDGKQIDEFQIIKKNTKVSRYLYTFQSLRQCSRHRKTIVEYLITGKEYTTTFPWQI